MSEMTIDEYGTKKWYNADGNLHRTDGPAIEWYDGELWWMNHNRLHRTDGPAIEYPDGDESWYINGTLHRLDGPALNHPVSSIIGWHIHGVRYYNFKDFQKAGGLSDEEMCILRLKYGEI